MNQQRIDATTLDPIAEMVEIIRRKTPTPNDHEIFSLHERCKVAFADYYGWRVGAPFSIDQLKRGTRSRRGGEKRVQVYDERHYDHVNYLRLPRSGKPTAFVTHSYRLVDDVEEAVRRDGLQIQWLSVIWCSPEVSNAGLVSL